MLERLSRHKRNLALLVLAGFLAWFSWTVRSVLNPLILGYLLAYILNPMVQNLERRGWGRRAAANLIFITFFLLAGGLLLAVVHQGRGLVRDLASTDFVGEVRRNLPEWIGSFLDGNAPAEESGQPAPDEVVDPSGAGAAGNEAPGSQAPGAQDAALEPDRGVARGADGGAADAGAAPGDLGAASGVEPSLRQALAETLRDLWGQVRAEDASNMGEIALRQASTVWPYLRGFFGSLVALATLLFLLPIYAYFLLFELDAIHGFVLRYIPQRERKRFERIGVQAGEVLANFFRGRLTICVLKGALIAVGLLVCGVPYFVFLGMGSGLLSLAPFLGPLLGFVAAGLLAVVEDGFMVGLLKAGIVFGLAEVLEGYVLMPRILGNSLGLHPVVILASVFVGGAAFGMFGLLIAVPITAALLIVAKELVLPALRAWADEDG